MAARQLFSDASRQQAYADALLQKATQNRAPVAQGRIVPKMGLGEGLTQLGEALLARRAGKQAKTTLASAEDARRQEQATALGGMGNGPNLVETQARQNPYARAQSALEADINPGVVESYLKSKAPGKDQNLFGVVDPSGFTPESLKKFAKTKDYGDLVPRTNTMGRYTPSNYTPESWAKFLEGGDPAALERAGNYRAQSLSGGGVGSFNQTTGKMDETPVTNEQGTAAAAARKEAEAKANALGEAQGKIQGAILSRGMQADSIEGLLDLAEPLIDEATGSGTGATRDKLASIFGVSTTGAQAIAALQPLQAAIMLQQPRMEGPQSDRDVELYRQAAGQIGDPNVPGETKKAALKTVRRLQQQYRTQVATAPQVPGAAPAATAKPGAVHWNDLQ